MKVTDSKDQHWVNSISDPFKAYLQLSRLDRPVGYWLLALPGWIGLALPAYLCIPGQSMWSPLYWASLMLIGAIAMRGAGCTYNDIVDRDLDSQVSRTQSRPLPSGRVSVKQAWIWLMIQVGFGFAVWLALPFGAKFIALLSLPLVAAYPFMKRITWWPQIWLGLTFNWAVLVAYAIGVGGIDQRAILLYLGLAAWTVGYDTIYALQDVEDDALIGIKSTARHFGNQVRTGIAISYTLSVALIAIALWMSPISTTVLAVIPFALHLIWQVLTLAEKKALSLFKSNVWAAALLIIALVMLSFTQM